MPGDAYYTYQARARGLKTAADVDALTQAMTSTYRSLLTAWLPARREALIYEVACGPGVLLRYLRQEGYTHASGSDSAECQIGLARAAGLTVALADSIQELESQPADHWDCLVAMDFIEHLHKDGLIRFFTQCQRTLKAGGTLILRAPNGDSPFVGRNLFNDITHVWAYTTVAMRALLEMAGFQRIEFADESLAGLQRQRWLKVPLMRLAQGALRQLIRAATRENVPWLHPSIFLCAWK